MLDDDKKKREKEKLDNLILECFEVKPKKLLILTRVFFSFRRSSSLKPLIYESISTQFRPYPIKKKQQIAIQETKLLTSMKIETKWKKKYIRNGSEKKHSGMRLLAHKNGPKVSFIIFIISKILFLCQNAIESSEFPPHILILIRLCAFAPNTISLHRRHNCVCVCLYLQRFGHFNNLKFIFSVFLFYIHFFKHSRTLLHTLYLHLSSFLSPYCIALAS